MLVEGLPHEPQNDLAKIQGGKPEEDDALITAMTEVGLAHEQFLRVEKLKERTMSVPSGKQKGKRKRKTEKSNATADEKNAPSGKKAKKDAAPVTGTGIPRFTKDQEEEAQSGIPQNLQDTQCKKGLCDFAVSRSTAGNGVVEKSPYHLPARWRKREMEKRRRTRMTLRRHQRQQPARLHSRETLQQIR